jgi:hypothetical protein
METFLRKPDVNHYSISEHVEFHEIGYDTSNKFANVIDAPVLIADYHFKLTQEQGIFKWIRRSEFTKKKAGSDHRRDNLYTGMHAMVRVNLRSFNPSLRDNALHVDNLLEGYGNVTHVDYDAETAKIESIITRLRSDAYIQASVNLGILPWIEELEAENTLFKSYVDDTAQEQIERPTLSPQVSRRETDQALRKITDRVTALANLNGPEAYTPFAAEFNTLVNHYNTLVHEHYGRMHARTDLTAVPSLIAPLEPQPATGRPVYLIPQVSVKLTDREGQTHTVELNFTVDFTVAYRDNVLPGTATLLIQGIGKYTGELVTTFNIVEN